MRLPRSRPRWRARRARLVVATTVTALAIPSAALHVAVACSTVVHEHPLRLMDAMSLLAALAQLAVVVLGRPRRNRPAPKLHCGQK